MNGSENYFILNFSEVRLKVGLNLLYVNVIYDYIYIMRINVMLFILNFW